MTPARAEPKKPKPTMKNNPSDQAPGSSPHAAGNVTLKRIVYPDGRWSEITMDTQGHVVQVVDCLSAEDDEVRVTTYGNGGNGVRVQKLTE